MPALRQTSISGNEAKAETVTEVLDIRANRPRVQHNFVSHARDITIVDCEPNEPIQTYPVSMSSNEHTHPDYLMTN